MALGSLLAENVSRVFPRPSPRRINRDAAIRLMVLERRGQPLGPETSVDTLARLDDIETVNLGEFLGGRPVPNGLLASDTLVRIPLTVRGMQAGLASGWGRQGGAIIVRGGTDPRVIGF